MCCGKQSIALRGHGIKKVDQATVSGLSSASDGPGIVLFDKEAGCPGNFIALLEFRAQADAAAVLRDFHHNGQGRKTSQLSFTPVEDPE